jgi:hypothetical protein
MGMPPPALGGFMPVRLPAGILQQGTLETWRGLSSSPDQLGGIRREAARSLTYSVSDLAYADALWFGSTEKRAQRK